MFERFYGFSAPPFQLSPDARFFFPSAVHQKAKSYLTYGLHQGEGFIIITGEVGAGKTTLVGHLLDTLDRDRFVAANVVSTQLNADDMLRLIALSFGLKVRTADKAILLQDLKEFFSANHAHGRRCLLLVDEAQNLQHATLEELRMLSNLQVNSTSPLQSFLLGQPQFRSLIAHPDLEQLRQRIIVSYHLGPIGAEDTRAYIEHRLRTVGWQGDPEITPDGHAAIFHATGGVPRRINKLCARLMLYGCIEERHRLNDYDVTTVVSEMQAEFDDRPSRAGEGAASSPVAVPTPVVPMPTMTNGAFTRGHVTVTPPEPGVLPAQRAVPLDLERRLRDLEDAVARQERLMKQALATAAALLEAGHL
jgi:putative secretion ATPase (PEP-CTERM system associated)